MTEATTAPRAKPVPVSTDQAMPDLWCTYAAVRTLAWLGRLDSVTDRLGTARYLTSRRNGDGGYAWMRGMASDAWATYYCTQGLGDLSAPVPAPERTARWLASTQDGGYAMMPGQRPDVWATYFSARTAEEACGTHSADPGRLLEWLGRLQAPDGGLGWSPDHAGYGESDARACCYGVMAWRALHRRTGAAIPWDVPRLVRWLRGRQAPDGGFTFAESAPEPCMWATYRAVTALSALGEPPADLDACVRWIMDRRGRSGAFVRWRGYPVEDVWASFCAIGALRALSIPVDAVADAVTTRVAELACPGGGYTYREPALAMDALTASAEALGSAPGPRAARLRAWLEGCLLPNEDGVMYMPGRGAEIRCTLWALEAGAFRGDEAARERIARWVTTLQNPDGGFGYWEGRASDVVSTVSALEAVSGAAGTLGRLDTRRLARFLADCSAPGNGAEPADSGYANVPRGAVTLRSTLQGLRARRILGDLDTDREVRAALERHRVPGGGYANEGNRLPDLLSTYEAVLAADRHGIHLDHDHLGRLLDRLSRADGAAWTPLAPSGGGALADCLHALLRRHVESGPATSRRLPALTLS